jgi:hypothetical protein
LKKATYMSYFCQWASLSAAVAMSPKACPEYNSATLSQIGSKLGMHASFNDPKCSAQELLLSTPFVNFHTLFLSGPFLLNYKSYGLETA